MLLAELAPNREPLGIINKPAPAAAEKAAADQAAAEKAELERQQKEQTAAEEARKKALEEEMAKKNAETQQRVKEVNDLIARGKNSASSGSLRSALTSFDEAESRLPPGEKSFAASKYLEIV